MECKFCKKEYSNRSGYSNHIRRCPQNPGRIIEKLTAEGKERIRQCTIEQNKKQWSDNDFRLRHKKSMQNAVESNPASYTSSNRGRVKQIIVDGVKLQGQWEVDFYNWAKENNLSPERPTRAFRYEWNGERWYHPDFYIPSLNLYVEVKGYETDRDRAKWNCFPENLVIIRNKEIQEIRKGIFSVPLAQLVRASNS